VEQVGLRIGDLVGHRELYVDDVLVTREHQARSRAVGSAADIDELFGHIGLFDGFDRPPMEMQTGTGNLFLRLAEAKLHRHLVRLDGVDGLEGPEHHKRNGNQPEHGRPAAVSAGQNVLQAVLAAPDDVFKIGRCALRAARATRPLAPGATAVSTAAPPWAAAALIVPGHECPFGSKSSGLRPGAMCTCFLL